MYSPEVYMEAARQIDAIEAEMRRAGYWSASALPPEAYDFTQAFGMDTMAFSSWLQFIFIPRVRDIIAERGAFPGRSQVGAQAVREFDTEPAASDLSTLLGRFDRYIESLA